MAIICNGRKMGEISVLGIVALKLFSLVFQWGSFWSFFTSVSNNTLFTSSRREIDKGEVGSIRGMALRN